MKFKVTNIKWDTDGKDIKLPDNVIINIDVDEEFLWMYTDQGQKDLIESEISDQLSDVYGYCHFGFDYKKVKDEEKC